MKNLNLYQDEPFSTYEAADIVRLGDHKSQVVAWVHRHLKPFAIDKSHKRKEIYKLDLVNIFELALIKVLMRHHLKPGDINRIVNKKQIVELLESDARNYLTILGGVPVPFIVNDPLALWASSTGAASALLVDFKEIERQVMEGIKKVRG